MPFKLYPTLDKYEKFMELLGLTREDVLSKTVPKNSHLSYDKKTGNLIVPPDYFPRQAELLNEYFHEGQHTANQYKLLKTLLFDAAFKAKGGSILSLAIDTDKTHEVIDLLNAASADELSVNIPPPLPYAIIRGKPILAMSIINKEGITPEQLLEHYSYFDDISSNSLRDAMSREPDNDNHIDKAIYAGIIDRLIEAATPELLMKKYHDGKTILEIAIGNGDEERAIAISKKCFEKFSSNGNGNLIALDVARTRRTIKEYKDMADENDMSDLSKLLESYISRKFTDIVKPGESPSR